MHERERERDGGENALVGREGKICCVEKRGDYVTIYRGKYRAVGGIGGNGAKGGGGGGGYSVQ